LAVVKARWQIQLPPPYCDFELAKVPSTLENCPTAHARSGFPGWLSVYRRFEQADQLCDDAAKNAAASSADGNATTTWMAT
jgi:hypothetical protein